jgi:hypothetical protein
MNIEARRLAFARRIAEELMDEATPDSHPMIPWLDANLILGMPEMQAIKAFCQWFAHRHGTPEDMALVLYDEAKLPMSVIDWVLS